ncbi:MAG: DUF2085 domain-containing protein [Methanomassiliicoccaceae archaeon]|nr:DUF2085 domain-containing protein [Methanomassiliicoccaceae archaeon]MCL2317631.1 DUF2085 domain-containing protein [Methanomassiliicoccaceae archaeon]
MDVSSPGRAVLLFLGTILVLMIVLPLLYPYGSFTGLDGSAGVIDNWGKLAFADPLTRGIYFLGDFFCHQETGRSFIINGSQMAFCQRDVSLLAGAVIGLILTDKKIALIPAGNKYLAILGLFMIASTFIEWGVESAFHVDVLAARIVTGAMAGAGVALILQYVFTKEFEKVVFGKG